MALIDFVRSLEASPALQQRVSQAQSPEPILALAAELGYSISGGQLLALGGQRPCLAPGVFYAIVRLSSLELP
jgi:hypothetical protein